jgi:hypothetical protein
MLGEWKLS